MTDKYKSNAHLAEHTLQDIIRAFADDKNAEDTAQSLGVSLNTIKGFFKDIRERINFLCKENSPFPQPELKVTSKYFPERKATKRNLLSVGLIVRQGNVYTQIVWNCLFKELLDIVDERMDAESTRYVEGFLTYDGIANGDFSQVEIVERETAQKREAPNTVDEFCNFANPRIVGLKGIPGKLYPLYIRECEFRFYHRGKDLYAILEKEFRENPL